MMLDTVLGNVQTLADLQQALRANRLMHSVLLCGAPGTGTGYAARCLAADYLYPGNAGAACLARAQGSAARAAAMTKTAVPKTLPKGVAGAQRAKEKTDSAAAQVQSGALVSGSTAALASDSAGICNPALAAAQSGNASSATTQRTKAPTPADLGAAQVMAGDSPEVLRIAGEGVSGDIKIDTVRAARSAVFHTALSASGRVVHIAGAEHLNASSANALLKVLEEPPEGVLFVLTAPSEASVLPTLRSRCACYTLAPVSEAVCADYLCTRFAATPNISRLAPEYAALLGGKIGMGVRCLTDETQQKSLDSAKQLADAVQANDTYYALITLAAQEKDRATARSFLALAREVCAAALRGAYPVPTPDKAARTLDAIREADAQLSRNGSSKLTLSCLAARITA